jgi:hypothetical protein
VVVTGWPASRATPLVECVWPVQLGAELERLRARAYACSPLPHLPEPLGEDTPVWAVATAEGMSDAD